MELANPKLLGSEAMKNTVGELIKDLDQQAIGAMVRVFGKSDTIAIMFHNERAAAEYHWHDDTVALVLGRIKASVEDAPLNVDGGP